MGATQVMRLASHRARAWYCATEGPEGGTRRYIACVYVFGVARWQTSEMMRTLFRPRGMLASPPIAATGSASI